MLDWRRICVQPRGVRLGRRELRQLGRCGGVPDRTGRRFEALDGLARRQRRRAMGDRHVADAALGDHVMTRVRHPLGRRRSGRRVMRRYARHAARAERGDDRQNQDEAGDDGHEAADRGSPCWKVKSILARAR